MFRFVVKQWLLERAREELSRSVEQLQRDEDGSRADVAVIAALSMELSTLADRLEDVTTTSGAGFRVRQGMLQGRRVVLAVSGLGREAARRTAWAVARAHRPSWLISAGFAGGLTEDVRRGDLLLVREVLDEAGGAEKIEWPVEVQTEQGGRDVRTGRLLSVDRIVREPREKARLGEEHDAAAVDMETMAVARVASELKLPLLAVRAISDSVDDRLPDDLENLVRQQSTAGKAGAALRAVFKRPSSVKDMYKLAESAFAAGDRLGRFLEGLIPALVPQSEADADTDAEDRP